jgi:deoxyinosine 3'endonuclease (endonuclease V)
MVNYYVQKSNYNLVVDDKNNYKHFEGKLFTGITKEISGENYDKTTYNNGIYHGVSYYCSKDCASLSIYIYNQLRLSFQVSKFLPERYDERIRYNLCYNFVNIDEISVEDGKRFTIENHKFKRDELNYSKLIDRNKNIIEEFHSYDKLGSIDLDTFVDTSGEENWARYAKTIFVYMVQKDMQKYLGHTIEDTFMGKFVKQEEQIAKTIKEDNLPSVIKRIAGVSVAYNEITQKMVSAIVVIDTETQEIVDQVFYEEPEDIIMHIPDLFAFNEVPCVLKAFEKLTIKPELIFCDGHGIEHPKNVGLATHLGIELDIPTIGCPTKRLVGYYDKEALGNYRGDVQDLVYDDKIVGQALRTQENTKPIYVSIGHKICLETARDWILKMTQNTRIPAVVQEAIKITKQILPEGIRYDFLDDEDNKYGIIK